MSRNEWNPKEINVIKNKNLVCNDCLFKTSSTITCFVFDGLKPLNVLRGGDCAEKEINN